MQAPEIQPTPWSIGAAMRDTHRNLGVAAGALLLPSLIYAVVNFGVGGGEATETDPTPGLIALIIIFGSLVFGALTMLQVFMLRRIAPALGITPRPVNWLAVGATGVVISSICFIGLFLLVIPGLIGFVLLIFATPIMAFEGTTGRDAMHASRRTGTVSVGATIALLLIAYGVPQLLNPALVGIELSTPTRFAWDMAVGTATTIYATLLIGIACMHARGSTPTLTAR